MAVFIRELDNLRTCNMDIVGTVFSSLDIKDVGIAYRRNGLVWYIVEDP